METLTRENVLAKALEQAHGSQAELATLTTQAQSTVSRWMTGKSTPDVEGSLLLARVTYLPKRAVLQVFGHDPDLLGIEDGQANIDPEQLAIANDVKRVPETLRPILRALIGNLHELDAAANHDRPTRNKGRKSAALRALSTGQEPNAPAITQRSPRSFGWPAAGTWMAAAFGWPTQTSPQAALAAPFSSR